MSEERNPNRNTGQVVELGGRSVRDIIASAGHRPQVPEEDLAAIKAAARVEWKKMVGQGSTSHGRSSRLPLALAATLVLALAAAWLWRGAWLGEGGAKVATVALLAGDASTGDGALAVGDTLDAESLLTTSTPAGAAATRLALRLTRGQSVRLDTDTRVRLLGDESMELLSGAVYVDSAIAGRSLEVRTAFGSVRDIGTQFEVRLGGDGEPAVLRVRVREGAIELRRESESHSAVAGEELRIDPDGALARTRTGVRGEDWEWVLASAPHLEIEGLGLSTFLDWASRETGWSIRYEDEALATEARGIELHGTIEGLSPDESVFAVVPGSGLDYRIEDGVLFIERLN